MFRHLAPFFFAVGLWLITLGATAQADAFLGSMSPAALVRGGTTRVTLSGSELGRGLDLWTSAPAGSIEAKLVEQSQDKQLTFDVTVTDRCPVGLYGLRLASTHGLSNTIIVLVDELVPRVVAPVNNAAPLAVTLPVSLAGTLRPTELDRFAFDVRAGETISFECVSSRLGKDADPIIRLRDPQGRVIVEHDNDPGLFFDFRFAHTFATAGRYSAEVFDARFHGDPEWNYVLRMGRFPAARVVVPSSAQPGQSVLLQLPELPGVALPVSIDPTTTLGRTYQTLQRDDDQAPSWTPVLITNAPSTVEVEPNDTFEQATAAKPGDMLCGVLGRSNDIDHFAFELKKGDRVELRAESATLDSAADIELAVIGPDGKETQRIDDVLLEEAFLLLNANRDGVWRVLVHDVTRGGGPAYAYRIETRRAGPAISVQADIPDVTLPQNETQSLPLIVTRTEYTGPIKLSLPGAPPGVTLEPNEIAEGQTKLHARLRADSSAPLGVFSIQVQATGSVPAKGDAAEYTISTIARTQPLIDRERYNVDLIKYFLRENQRRLPPSLTNQIALQIAPPTPFSVELPQPEVTLVRYLSIDVPIQTTRVTGFKSPITFKARGGQLGEEREIRRQIYTRFQPAGPEQLNVAGKFLSRNLPNEAKDRIDLFATAIDGDRKVTLVRSFDLELKAGFDVVAEPKPVSVLPGEKVKFELVATRLPPFTGAITVEQSDQPNQGPPAGITLPEKVVIPAGKDRVEVELSVAADVKPGRLRVRLESRAPVGEFLEEPRPKDVEIEVKKPDVKPAEAKK
ncbi:MAG: hypothetical protein JNM18_07660 [Planctomycetaceae bacterium]|nr:hypothetical protein [Planctomycetaceae bacterium]